MLGQLPAGSSGRWFVAGLAATLMACTGGPPQDLQLGQQQRRINNGLPEPGEPAVMLIFHQSGSMCTGTLIGRRVVLTAKHCVQRDNGSFLSTWGYQIGVGPNMWAISHTYGVTDVRATTGTAIENSDVAVLILDSDAQETPYPYVLELPANIAGGEALLIGYGVNTCPGDQSGTKLRTIDDIISWYSENDFLTQGRGANQGDSGGPVFDPDTMAVMGVISRGSYDVCDGYTVVAAVAPWKALINQALEDTGDCAPTATEDICGDNIDNNCDGMVDNGCAPVGTACQDDTECASRYCRDLGEGFVCSEPCEPGGVNTCPQGAVCLYAGCDQGACVIGQPGAKRAGEPCQSHLECENLMCLDPGFGTAICMAPCHPDLGQCLATEACLPLDANENCGGCAPDNLATGARHLGERCEASTQCASGNCFADGGLSYCSQACDQDAETCPDGFHCRGDVCTRGHLGVLADPCLTDEDCNSDHACFGSDPANRIFGYCTVICSGGVSCPTGSTCEANACVPSASPLGQDCVNGPECTSGACFPFAEQRSCTTACDRRVSCPPLLACVVSDSGETLCQPHSDPLVEGPTDPLPVPNPKPKCSTGTSGGLGLPLLLMLLFVWIRRRR